MKLSEYIFAFLESKRVNTVFYLPGGGCMHLLDSLGANTNIQAVSLLHEQAVAIATESYANTTGIPGVALVTTGPGGTNAVTGVLAAYLDSSAAFFISGQVKTADLKSRYGVRGLGGQEADIVSIVSPITKYAVMVTDKNTIRYHMERAWHEMVTGRQGPVWIDIPLDLQGAQIEPETLAGYAPVESERETDVARIIALLNSAKRPVIIAGNGLARCKNAFFEMLEFLQIPVIPTWKAMDYIPNGHPLYAGRAGGMGDRHGNLTMQNSDLILSLGSRLDFSITGYERSGWAPRAKKIVVDLDEAEISKLEGATDVVPVVADAGRVVDLLLRNRAAIKLQDITAWKEQISLWKRKYPVITEEKCMTPTGGFTTYGFVDALSRLLSLGAYITPCSSGTTAEIFFQAFTVKRGQTIRSNHGLGAMGFEIPGAIGMCIASGGKETVCVAGDGGMQLNMQELAVIAARRLPIKIFVLNNNGYASIRNMQNNHFQGRYVGCDGASGLYLPELEKTAFAYGLEFFRADSFLELEDVVGATLRSRGPAICELCVEGDCLVTPRNATQILPDGALRSSPLENQFPFLTDDEVRENTLL